MFKLLLIIVPSVISFLLISTPARAQGVAFDTAGLYSAAAGTQAYTTFKTGAVNGVSQAQVAVPTTRQIPSVLPVTTTQGLTPVYGIRGYGVFFGLGYDLGNGSGGNTPNFNDTYTELANQAEVAAFTPDPGGYDTGYASTAALQTNPYGAALTPQESNTHI